MAQCKPQMVRALEKKKYRCSPGLVEAAKALGCSVSHLRRVVVYKQRSSKSLTARYRAFKASVAGQGKYLNSPSAPAPAQAIGSAVAENLNPEVFKSLQFIGVEVVIVRFSSPTNWPIRQGDGIESVLESELIRVSAGQYYASDYLENCVFHVFHVFTKRLGAALTALKAAVEARGLLPVTTILHGESHESLRIYYPPHHPETQVVHVPTEDQEGES